MGINDQLTLIEFENTRKELNIIPPVGSNSFYTIGDGQINLLVKRNDPEDYRFELFTNQGNIHTGDGNFIISGDIQDIDHPYENFTVIKDTQLSVDNQLTISRGNLEVHGTLELLENSQIIIRNNANVILYIDSTFIIRNNTKILIEKGSSLTIYGIINVHLNRVTSIMNTDGIIIDSAAVMVVDGLESLGNRSFSLKNYDEYLRTQIINIHTQGEINKPEGRMGYTWVGGSPLDHSQLIDISILNGEAILGDFKFSVLGTPDHMISNLQMIRNLKVCKKSILYISEEYNGSQYIRPDLYLGIIIDNNKMPANLEVDGTIIVNGENSFITVDRGSTIHLNKSGEIHLKNNACIRCTHNEEDIPLFYIDGTLYIDDIEQIRTFTHDNIVLGDTGKIVVYNPDTGEKRLLWSTPNGIEGTDLYRLFKDRIDHVEYHVSNNTGIEIDQDFEFFNRQFTQWYGERRIEKAIHDGILIWHDGGFIQLNQSILPWINEKSNLLSIAKLFKTFGSYDSEKLQECVDRLRYAGSGNIIFRFIVEKNIHEVTLNLEDVSVTNVYNQPMTTRYVVNATNDGQIFLRNHITHATKSNLLHPNATVIDIIDKEAEFQL